MTSIDDIIKSEINPFDTTTFRPGNFWRENQEAALTVDSIHQQAIADIEELLNLVNKDNHSRTILLTGDSGSGKSYLLGRLKRTFNSKAFFAYIDPWPDSEYIWRHTLRYTVDSLTHIPENQEESQLILWLKSLAAFKKLTMKELIFDRSVWDLLQSDRQKFIKKLKDTYKQAGIFNADNFFGVLHDLTNPELNTLACEWLRGDDLSEESMQALKVKHCIDSEDAAKNILANFGRIATATQPIVLCFDNLDNIPRLPDGFQDIQPLFNINTCIHNEHLKSFLVIVSFITDNWRRNGDRIQQADKARIDKKIQLRNINLSQVETLWANRLNPIHSQANPKPESAIFPLSQQILAEKFPGGKTDPRSALMLGREKYQEYKDSLVTPPPPSVINKIKAAFQLLWQDEFNKITAKIKKIALVASPELIKMLQEALASLEIKEIKPKLLKGNFGIYSFSYLHPDKPERVGVIWTEEINMNNFFHVMTACKRAIDERACQTMNLIRIVNVGNPNLAGHKIYHQIFTGSSHCHIKPTLASVHYLATYHNLVNAALAKELVVAGKLISLDELQQLMRQLKALDSCTILQDLGIVSNPSSGSGEDEIKDKLDLIIVKESIVNLVKTQGVLGKYILVRSTLAKFPQANSSQVEQLIQQLCHAKQLQIMNPKDKPAKQLVCFIG